MTLSLGPVKSFPPDPPRGPSMRKAIQLSMDVEVEGDDEPQHDFARRAIQAVRDAVKVGRSRYPDLTITVHKVEPK